jgi:hypothetical protein
MLYQLSYASTAGTPLTAQKDKDTLRKLLSVRDKDKRLAHQQFA